MLIIDMPMPKKSCYECPCADHENRRCQADKDERYYDFNIPKWCPIKGVLPDEHGDLIDRQDAIKEFEPYAEYESNRSNAEWVGRIKAVLNLMTAVIESERKNDGKD